jgi:hypothetical protein
MNLFNYDSVVIAGMTGTAIIVGGLFTYSIYNIFTTTAIVNESLVNTSSILTPSENTTPIPVPDPTPLPVLEPGHLQYVDAAVQTGNTSLWEAIKEWFRGAFSVNSSEIESIGINGVNNWRNNLDSVQSVSLQVSESSLTRINSNSNSTLQNMIGPGDSASMVSGPVSDVATSVGNAIEIIDPMFITTTVSGREFIDPIILMFGG